MLSPAALRYQLPSQEEAKERRRSHAAAGLPESDDQSELPSPPALSMSLSAKGQLTNIGQHHGDRRAPRGQGGGPQLPPHAESTCADWVAEPAFTHTV